MYDETIHQKKKDGTLIGNAIIDADIIPGIKVDTGAKDMAGHPGEKVTEGLDGLRERLNEYFRMGARFAKWRAVIAIGDGIPSRACIEANANALAVMQPLCQEAGLVPIVEPEVLMEGDHDLQLCFNVTEEVLRTVFNQLYLEGVMLQFITMYFIFIFFTTDSVPPCQMSHSGTETLSQNQCCIFAGSCIRLFLPPATIFYFCIFNRYKLVHKTLMSEKTK